VKIAYPPGATPLDPNEAAGLIPNGDIMPLLAFARRSSSDN
jgi:hypothetical protein